MSTPQPPTSVAPFLLSSRLIVCVGSGGVGKTTTSASIALNAALLGKRVLVLTIDPAKRLANAMGLEELENRPQPINVPGSAGTLDAMMLDAITSFDDMIRETAGKDAPQILTNRVYRTMVDHFAGVQEYMAVVRLFDMYRSGKWDLIVLDTPPAKHAVDFFAASKRAAALFDERIMRWFLPNAKDSDAGFFQRLFNPGTVVLKLLSMIGGEQFVAELSEFFSALNIIRDKLHERGETVDRILQDPTTQYVVIASPDPRRVSEAIEFHERLQQLGKQVALFILNRSHHRFAIGDLEPLKAAARVSNDDHVTSTTARLENFYSELLVLAERDRASAENLTRRFDRRRVRVVPVFGEAIHKLEQLAILGDRIVT